MNGDHDTDFYDQKGTSQAFNLLNDCRRDDDEFKQAKGRAIGFAKSRRQFPMFRDRPTSQSTDYLQSANISPRQRQRDGIIHPECLRMQQRVKRATSCHSIEQRRTTTTKRQTREAFTTIQSCLSSSLAFLFAFSISILS